MYTHIGYSDESKYNIGRYRGVGMISLPVQYTVEANSRLTAALEESNVHELKWNKLKTAKYRFAAQRIMEICLASALRGCLRIDVLIWDIKDGRHDVIGRDDLANLQRMYYHLLQNVLEQRWPAGSTWALFPDEQSAIKWSELGSYLSRAGVCVEGPSFFDSETFALRLQSDYNVQTITPIRSLLEPLCQAADLFVGLGVFSWEKFSIYQEWVVANPKQLVLFENDIETGFSRSEQERCFILREFNSFCKKHRLTVSLQTHHGLCTKDPRRPVNFWLYQPQHYHDIAPLRNLSIKHGHKKIK